MAPKKKPSMLQRQRQLRSQQQQVKKASSNQLPPKGGSSGNSRQARAQRTGTLKAQAANQQRVIARGMEGFIRRGQAQDKLDKAAKGSTNPGTRTAGAGGGLAKRPSSSVQRRAGTQPSSSGGSMQAPGGRVQRSGSGSASSNRVEQVRVRDLGSNPPNRMGGGAQRALPPGRSGGALTRAGGTARAAAGAAGGAGRFLGALGTALAIPSAIKNIADVAERNRQWEAYKERMGMTKPSPGTTSNSSSRRRAGQNDSTISVRTSSAGTRRGAATGSRTRSAAKPTNPPLSSTGVRTANGNTVPTGSPEYNRYRNQQLADAKRRNESIRDTTPTRRTSSSGSGSGSSGSTSRSGGSSTRPQSSSRPQAAPAPRFTGTVDEGRKLWAEKYSSSKYDGQAIQKEAKKLLEKMKERKEQQSAAQRAGWDGNKNY